MKIYPIQKYQPINKYGNLKSLISETIIPALNQWNIMITILFDLINNAFIFL